MDGRTVHYLRKGPRAIRRADSGSFFSVGRSTVDGNTFREQYLERQDERPLHFPGGRIHRQRKARVILIGRDRIISLGAEPQGAVRSREAPVADTCHHHIRIPVGVFEGADAPGNGVAVELGGLSVCYIAQ